jgi:hypothetical protein
MDKKAKETAISNQISALKVISDNIGFTPDYFHSPQSRKELELYVHQFVDFIREENQVEIVTEWLDTGGYFSNAWGIKDKYRDSKNKLIHYAKIHYAKSNDTLSTSFLESQIKAIEIVVEKLLEEEKDAGTQTGE